MDDNLPKILASIMILIVALTIYTNSNIEKSLLLGEEQDLPKVTATSIKTNCEKCKEFDTQFIKDAGYKVIKEKVIDQGQAKTIISKYGIKKLPALIVEGDTSIELSGNKIKEAYVFEEAEIPYFDIESNKVKGLVKVTTIYDEKCNDCYDIKSIVQELEKGGIMIDQHDHIELSEAKELLKKYNITKVPAFIADENLGEYSMVQQNWNQIGTIEEDGSYVLRDILPPYKVWKTGELKGLVDLTYLSDKTCQSCYNASVHKDILSQIQFRFGAEKFVDVSTQEGKDLIEKYNIDLVPTVIISEDAADYSIFPQLWSQLGTQEEDGKFIFRNVGLMQDVTYKNISSGRVMTSG